MSKMIIEYSLEDPGPKKIRIKYHADIDHIEKHEKGDLIDLRTAEDVCLEEGQYKEISLGISMQLPEGYEAWVIPRSSTFKKYGVLLSNSCGLIDERYCGDGDIWHFPVYATKDCFIPKNTRICQFRIFRHQPEIEFEEVETLGNDDRGGFGSTGEN